LNDYSGLLGAFLNKEASLVRIIHANSFVFHMLKKVPHNSNLLRKFASRKMKGWNIKNQEKIMFPVCDNGHWWLIYVDVINHSIFSIDSFNVDHEAELNVVIRLFETMNLKEWRSSIMRSNQQVDGINCGAYVMFAMTLITFGNYDWMYQHFTLDKILPFRCYVFNCIIQREIHVLSNACPKCKLWYKSRENAHDGEMVGCDSCNIWTHLACTHYSTLDEAAEANYICIACNVE
jgi:Ulp1 protease family, C-terminal catalytic domain/PHD-finger